MFSVLILAAVAVAAFVVAYNVSPKFRAWVLGEEAAVKAEVAKVDGKSATTAVGTAAVPTGTGATTPVATEASAEQPKA